MSQDDVGWVLRPLWDVLEFHLSEKRSDLLFLNIIHEAHHGFDPLLHQLLDGKLSRGDVPMNQLLQLFVKIPPGDVAARGVINQRKVFNDVSVDPLRQFDAGALSDSPVDGVSHLVFDGTAYSVPVKIFNIEDTRGINGDVLKISEQRSQRYLHRVVGWVVDTPSTSPSGIDGIDLELDGGRAVLGGHALQNLNQHLLCLACESVPPHHPFGKLGVLHCSHIDVHRGLFEACEGTDVVEHWSLHRSAIGRRLVNARTDG